MDGDRDRSTVNLFCPSSSQGLQEQHIVVAAARWCRCVAADLIEQIGVGALARGFEPVELGWL